MNCGVQFSKQAEAREKAKERERRLRERETRESEKQRDHAHVSGTAKCASNICAEEQSQRESVASSD